MKLIKRLIFFIYAVFIKKMIKEMSPYIKKHSRVLDLGCGRGFLSFFINKKLGVETLGIDVVDNRKIDIPFTFYNGKKMSFPDNHFDVVLIAYVLHHTSNIETLLKEAKRVTKGKIIIYEDTPENSIQRIYCWLHGKLFNKFFKIASDCCFLSKANWLFLFKKYRFKPVYVKDIKIFNPIYITKRTLFVLEE